jgi:hypothetical protein
MTRVGWEKVVNSLKERITLIKSRANTDSTSFEKLRRQAECLKVQFLVCQLEGRRMFLARSRGFASAVKNRKGLPAALGFAAAASVVTGMMTKNGLAAADAGLSSFNRVLQGLGETDWAVYLGGHLLVAPRADITPGQGWFTWGSFKTATYELEERAKNGAGLGNLDAVISGLQKTKRLVIAINRQVIRATT